MRRLIVLIASVTAMGFGTIPPAVAVQVDEPDARTDITVIAGGANWNYHDGAHEPGARWWAPGRSLSSWKSGPAPLGYGYRRLATTVAPNRRAYYLRTSFRVARSTAISELRLRAQIADGAVAYLNGFPIWRFNIGAAPERTTRAGRTVRKPRHWRTAEVPPDLLRVGRNVLAVELHDHSRRQGDVRFDLILSGRVGEPGNDPVDSPTPSPTTAPSPTATASPTTVPGPTTGLPLPDPATSPPASPTVAEPTSAPVDTSPRVMCAISDPRLPEISGLASSVRHDGIVWAHNDSGDSARIFAIDVTTCVVRAVVALNDVTARDIEAIGMGRDPAGNPELWVADVGDNNVNRAQVQLYHFTEPAALVDQSVAVDTVQVTWTVGPRNCETLLVDPVPNGDLYLVTKEAVGGVYRLGGDFRADGTATTGAPIGTVGSTPTDGAVAPDRSSTIIRYYTDAQLMSGIPGTDPRPLTLPAQRQGEAITFTPDSRYVYIASEGVTDLIRVPVAGT